MTQVHHGTTGGEVRELSPPRSSRRKRAVDICGAVAGLLASSPLLAGAAVAVRLFLGSPVFYRQERPGLDGESFRIVKLRTMSDRRDEEGNPLPDAERLTRLGRTLRATSIDELPELWNVLRGDMSLVGPRPLLHRYTPFLTERERIRLQARPGITGWAQIHGRNDTPWDKRLAFDVEYVENWSVKLDLQILLTTVARVLRRSGVVTDPGSTMLDLDEERRLRAAS